jgi:hypothetical protein
MVSSGLFILSVLRALVEVAGMFLLAQGALHVLAGARREVNIVYRGFKVITRPVIRMARFITPAVIGDRQVPVVAFLLLFWMWIGLAYLRRVICDANGLACG